MWSRTKRKYSRGNRGRRQRGKTYAEMKKEVSASRIQKERRSSTKRLSGVCQTRLVVQLQGKLNLPRIIRSVARGSNFAEGRTVVVARVGNGRHAVPAEIRRVEVRMVKDVKDLRSELKLEAFRQ